MKGVVVTTDLDIRVEDFADPLYKTVGVAVDGYIEHVRPMRLKEPFCMVVNDEGQLRGLSRNLVGSFLYGTDLHGEPVVGNIVIMKDGYRNGEHDIVGLTDEEVMVVQRNISTLISKLKLAKGDPT